MTDRILVVEDNDDLSILFKLVLESAGYRVRSLGNGYDTLKEIEAIQPQLVLMDIMMPEVNGLDVARDIKQQQEYKSLPILLVSAVDRLKDKQLENSKADGILYKPFDIDDLVAKVGRLLAQGARPVALPSFN